MCFAEYRIGVIAMTILILCFFLEIINEGEWHLRSSEQHFSRMWAYNLALHALVHSELELSFSWLSTIIYSLKFHCPVDHLPTECWIL